MKCNRCEQESAPLRRLAWCPDSTRPLTFLCLTCWADLQVWLRPPPQPLVDELLSGHDGMLDFVRPMGVE